VRHAALASLAVALVSAACAGSGEPQTPASSAAKDTAAANTTAETTTAATETTASADKAPFKPLSNAERSWVRRYAAWRDDLFGPVATIEDIRSTWRYILLDPDYKNRPVAKYLRTLTEVERCARTLGRDVGAPPGVRLDEVHTLLKEGCELMKRSAASDREAVAAKDIDGFDESQGDWDEAILRHEKADEAVLQQLTFMRPLPTKRGRTGASRIEPVFSDVATKISVENQEVRCWSRRDWDLVLKDRSAYTAGKIEPNLLGFAGLAEPAHLSPDVCEDLVKLRYARARPEGSAKAELADAVVVLAHEAEHVIGTVNEAVTECRAMQRAREVARLLGAPKSYADSLADTFWEQVYPYNLPAYRTDGCRDGGPLDLRPKSPLWP
jgi:hypothetical protein